MTSSVWNFPTTFARVSEVKAGDILVADGGFTCLCNFALRAVKINSAGELYIDCCEPDTGPGTHILDGQVSTATDKCHDPNNPVYIGLWKYDPTNPPPPETLSGAQIACIDAEKNIEEAA